MVRKATAHKTLRECLMTYIQRLQSIPSIGPTTINRKCLDEAEARVAEIEYLLCAEKMTSVSRIYCCAGYDKML